MLVHATWPAHSSHDQAPQIHSLGQLAEICMSNSTISFHILISHITACQQQGPSTRQTLRQGIEQGGHHVVTDLFTLMAACLGQGQVHE
jgi:hypothetical protein